MFVAMGLSAILPVIHGLTLYGFTSMNRRIGLSWLVLQGVLYIVGAGLYAVSIQRSFSVSNTGCRAEPQQARIPECLHPGRYDLYGSSHQIFHVLILLAAMSHLMGLLTAFEHAQIARDCR